MLLMLDDESGKFIPVPEHCVCYALAGAVLMELAFQGKIDTDPEKLFPTDCDTTGDDLLDPVLHQICTSEEQRDLRYWVDVIRRKYNSIRDKALARLCEKGLLRLEKGPVFGLIRSSRRFPTCDGSTERQEVKLRMMSLLFREDIPEPRDVAIISLADTCGLFEYILAPPELKRAQARIDRIRNLELIDRVLKSAVADIEMQIARITMRQTG